MFGLGRPGAELPLNRLVVDRFRETPLPRRSADIPVTQMEVHPVVDEVTINRGRQELLVLVGPFITPDEPSLDPHRPAPSLSSAGALIGVYPARNLSAP